MSTVETFAPGSMLLHYRLIDRIGTSVWKAEDTRSGKAVAIKILARQLPRDLAKRDALVRDVRLGAALYHTSLVNIIEIVPAGDALILIMELVEGDSIATLVHNKPMDRTTFFRVVYQAADALKLLHAKNVVHGNINGESVLLTPAGQVKIAGLNFATFLQKREGQPSAFQLRGNDARSVAYMAPEQITNQPVTFQSDIFSLGLVMYEMATGKQAYNAATAADIARKVVSDPPPSPKTLNERIDNAVLTATGKCLFKDPFRRYKDAKALVDDVLKAEPDAASFAMEVARAATAPTAAQLASKPRQSILLLADIAEYEQFEADDPAAAQKAAARLQQLIGEAAYLFDGEVIDPFGPRVIAELPTVENALEAARKAEFDFSPDQQEGAHIPVRLLLHYGDVITRDGQVAGDCITKGFAVLSAVPPLKLFLSEDFAKKAKNVIRMHDAGARAGVKLYEIVPPEPKPEPETEVHTADLVAEVEAEAAAEKAAAEAAKRKSLQTQLAVAAVLVVVLIGAAGAFIWKRSKTPKTVATVAAPLAPATAATPRKIFLDLGATDAALTSQAASVRLASLEILRAFPEIRIADAAGPGVTSIVVKMRNGTAGAEIVPDKGTPLPAADAATAIQSVLQFAQKQVGMTPHPPAQAAALTPFADAVAAFNAADNAKTESSLRASMTADPNFLPAQLLALRFFDLRGRQDDALAAARQIIAIDPTNADAARRIGRASLRSGDLNGALTSFETVLKKRHDDAEALNVIGRYAVAVPDPQVLAKVLNRLPPSFASVHPPDLLLAAGRIDDAVAKFYEIEQGVSTPALSLKIGRLAVLRHSKEIADIELKKLQSGDPNYGAHMLKAYIAAESNDKPASAAELHAAFAGSVPGDDYWTCAAEVAAIGGDARGALDALERAAERKEPTAAYILANPLFRFLGSDARFQKVRDELTAEQAEIRGALANLAL